ITGAIYAGQLFIFDELFCDEGPEGISQLLRATGASPKNSDEALGLAKLYLSLSYYGLKDPAQFVVSSVDELPKEMVTFPDESINDIREVLYAPRVVLMESGYDVDLFTTDLDRLRIHRWRMRIDSTGIRALSDQRIYPNYREMRDLYARISKKTAQADAKIELWHC